MNKTLEELGKAGKSASLYMNSLSTRKKNDLLVAIATALESNISHILEENDKDMEQARRKNFSPALLDRLLLTSERLKNIAQDVLHVSSLADPVGQILDGSTVSSGLRIYRKRVPLGVVGVIYEARPNVTVDVASLCLKTGNAVILRGGRETTNTNRILVSIIQRTLGQYGLPVTAVQFVESPDRQIVSEMLKLDKYIDIIIPRGGSALQQLCKEVSTIPVIIGGIGVCHIFIDSSADIQKSLSVIDNAKTQRPSVCNALETLLVHESVASDFLPMLSERLGSKNVIFHACPKALPILENVGANVISVKNEDYAQEWLTLDLNIKIVKNLQEALEHIHIYSSGHSESILTENINNSETFVMHVDAAVVYVNASTRFTDGGEFGLGAEVAVSTQKLHARGPMGLDALTTYKWIAHGNYLSRE